MYKDKDGKETEISTITKNRSDFNQNSERRSGYNTAKN